MSAANVIVPKGIPIFVVGNCGVPTDALNLVISRSVPAQLEIIPGIMEGLQTLVLRERGILVVELNDAAALSTFAKIFKACVKDLKLSDIKIVVLSQHQEIILSRALTQFTFIRTMGLFDDPKKAGAMLVRDYREMETRSTNKTRRVNMANSEIIIIKGEKAEAKEDTAKVGPEKKENPLLSCVGESIPSFLYDKSCNWRVRGHFSQYTEATSSVIFVPDDEIGTQQLNKELKETQYLISSTSSVRARICMTLDFTGRNGNNSFIFKTPTLVQEIQRRTDPRLRVPEDYPIVCQFFDKTMNNDLALSVLDLSSGGIGVRIDRDLIGNFKAEQMIGDIVIIFSQRIIKIPAVEVRHTSRSDVNPEFKILGLKFMEVDKKDKAFIDMYVESRSTFD